MLLHLLKSLKRKFEVTTTKELLNFETIRDLKIKRACHAHYFNGLTKYP